MKIRRIPALVMAVTLLALFYGGTAAWAQGCPTSPNYTPDFSSNQSCLTLTNNGADPGYPGFYAPVTPTSGVTAVLRLTPNAGGTAGSAWFNAQQPVAGAFSTTFTFQLSGTTTYTADGIAFVIQNSASTALGADGGYIGFAGVPNSLAVEFDTFQNDDFGDVSNNHVAIQSCGTSANTADSTCRIADFNLYSLGEGAPIMADGNVHTVTITYTPPNPSGPCEGGCPGSLNVILDNIDLFPGGVTVNLSTLLSLTNGNAWVGFTAATGGGNDNQDILSWTFTPQAQSAVVSTGTTATLSFQNAAQTTVYDYTAKLTAGSPVDVQVKPILMTPEACDDLVQRSFWPARCFVYENAENSGLNASVMFEVTCPQSQFGTCGSTSNENFFAELGTDFDLVKTDNPLFIYPGIFGPFNPFPGFLKGVGPDPTHPCTPPTTGPLFQSNQIDAFFIDARTSGGSGGGGSCWVATYDTPGEAPPGITISSPAFTTYTQNQPVAASYTCKNPITSKPSTSPTGPYLTVLSCTQNQVPVPHAFNNTNNCTRSMTGLTCSGPVDTSILGLHAFSVTAIDTGGNTNVQAVVYAVRKH